MARKKGFKKMESLALQADKTLQDLAGIAFANILDFARFQVDGRVHIFDWEKAREVGAQVSVVTRKIGRGKNTQGGSVYSDQNARQVFSLDQVA